MQDSADEFGSPPPSPPDDNTILPHHKLALFLERFADGVLRDIQIKELRQVEYRFDDGRNWQQKCYLCTLSPPIASRLLYTWQNRSIIDGYLHDGGPGTVSARFALSVLEFYRENKNL